MNRDWKEVLEGLLGYVHEWTFEDTGNGERNYCESCGVEYSVGERVKKHKPNCELESLLGDAQFLLDEAKRTEETAEEQAGGVLKNSEDQS